MLLAKKIINLRIFTSIFIRFKTNIAYIKNKKSFEKVAQSPKKSLEKVYKNNKKSLEKVYKTTKSRLKKLQNCPKVT